MFYLKFDGILDPGFGLEVRSEMDPELATPVNQKLIKNYEF